MGDINFRVIDSRKATKGERRMTFVASDGSRDSHGTVLNQSGWDLTRFNNNPIIGYQHEVYGSWDATDPNRIIGKGYAYVKDDKLMVDVDFEPAEINQLADTIWKKLEFGSLNAVSVGFRAKGQGTWGKGEEDVDGSNPTYYFAGQELLEISVVNIPSNPNAIKNSAEENNEFIQTERQRRLDEKAAEAKSDLKQDEELARELEKLNQFTKAADAAIN